MGMIAGFLAGALSPGATSGSQMAVLLHDTHEFSVSCLCAEAYPSGPHPRLEQTR